jgi:hypothetical protein
MYWSSTKAPVHLFKREYESAELAKYVKENSFVDAAMLADELKVEHLNTWAVEAYQRRLGVRKIASWKDRK